MNSESNILDESINYLDIIDGEINQLKLFHEDFLILNKHTLGKYREDFKKLCDETDRLRAEYSIIYSKILEEKPELKIIVGSV